MYFIVIWNIQIVGTLITDKKIMIWILSFTEMCGSRGAKLGGENKVDYFPGRLEL